jgi:hypothetical protein
LRAEGFTWSLDVLYGGIGISKLQVLIKKKEKFSVVHFSSVFGQQNPGSGLDTDKDLYPNRDPYPDPDSFSACVATR